MNELIPLSVIIVFLVAVLFAGRKIQVLKLEREKEIRRKEKEQWKKEMNISIAKIEDHKSEVIQIVETVLENDHPNQAKTLKKIIKEWAELKEKTFLDRRSWVRKPEDKSK